MSTLLRERMLQDLQLAGLVDSTQRPISAPSGNSLHTTIELPIG